jgi:hypothetical protein
MDILDFGVLCRVDRRSDDQLDLGLSVFVHVSNGETLIVPTDRGLSCSGDHARTSRSQLEADVLAALAADRDVDAPAWTWLLPSLSALDLDVSAAELQSLPFHVRFEGDPEGMLRQ